MKLLKIILAAAAIIAPFKNASAQSFLTNGLVAYYPFNGNGNDASGHGNNLTVVGTGGFVSGNLGGAINFDGKTNYCYTASRLVSSNPFTWSCWVKITSKTNPFICFMEQTTTSSQVSPFLSCSINTNTSTLTYSLYTYSGTAQNLTSTTNNLNTNQWVQLVGVSDASGIKSIYVNGLLEGTSSAQLFGQTLNHFSLGTFYGSPQYPYQLDEVRVYNRALSSSEVAQLYSIESSGPNLGISTYNNSPVVFYPTAIGTNYTLRMTTNLASPNWVTVTNGVPFSGVQITNAPSNAFFQLQ